jgi:hypothetical protein
MRTLGRLVFLIPLFFALPASVAHADSISVGDRITFVRGPSTAGGGAFFGTVVGTGEQFITFCLQVERPLDFGPEYTVEGITDYTYWDDDNRGGDPITGRDYLSAQTQWLYSQLRGGTLSGYTGSAIANDAFQWAVWTLEEEEWRVLPGQPYSALGNHFIDLANQAVQNGYRGDGSNVHVLNLRSWDGVDIQDQLALVATPEPPTLALLVCGLFGLTVTRRRWLPAVTR